MLMPKAAEHLNDSLMPGKYNVRSAGQGADVKPVSEAHSVNQSPDTHLRRGIH